MGEEVATASVNRLVGSLLRRVPPVRAISNGLLAQHTG